jgi:hypothetical protein
MHAIETGVGVFGIRRRRSKAEVSTEAVQQSAVAYRLLEPSLADLAGTDAVTTTSAEFAAAAGFSRRPGFNDFKGMFAAVGAGNGGT